MLGRRIVRSVGLALGSFAVCNFLHVNTALSLKGLSGALVDNEARISWIVWFIRLFPDFISLWTLRKIGFLKKGLLEKINRLSLSAKKRMEADNYSEYAEDRERDNFYFIDFYNLLNDRKVVWGSFNYWKLRYPGFPGEKIKFHGYDFFGAYLKEDFRGRRWGWLTVGVNGDPIMLVPGGFVASSGDENYQREIYINRETQG